jgi:hypothetical protein
MKTNLFLCETIDRLAEVIADFVFNSYCGVNGKRTHVFYPIQFYVDDTPTPEEWKKMTAKEKKNAAECATGAYGIVDIGEQFDAECNQLACAYYGGSNICTTKVFDGDDSYETIYDELYDMLDDVLFCDARKNILLKIKTVVEII